MSLKNKTSIFESRSQVMELIDPATVKPVWDRVLLRDVEDQDKIGSIWIPETAAERGVGKGGNLRLGIVVSTGRGDKFIEEGVMAENGLPKRHQLGPCRACQGLKTTHYDVVNHSWDNTQEFPCNVCQGDGMARWPMYCSVGDTVIYDRRKECEIYFYGQRHTLIHEEQSVFAVIMERNQQAQPIYDRILVRRIADNLGKTPGGLYIPDSSQEPPQEGMVMRVGVGKRLRNGKLMQLDVQPGQRIVFGKYAGAEVSLQGEKLLIMQESEVFGIIEA